MSTPPWSGTRSGHPDPEIRSTLSLAGSDKCLLIYLTSAHHLHTQLFIHTNQLPEFGIYLLQQLLCPLLKPGNHKWVAAARKRHSDGFFDLTYQGMTNDYISFSVDEEKIDRELSIKSFYALYCWSLRQTHGNLCHDAALWSGLGKIDRSHLPGKFEVWCYQFTLLQCLMWLLKLCEKSLPIALWTQKPTITSPNH